VRTTAVAPGLGVISFADNKGRTRALFIPRACWLTAMGLMMSTGIPN
jgi:hypothetical protein